MIKIIQNRYKMPWKTRPEFFTKCCGRYKMTSGVLATFSTLRSLQKASNHIPHLYNMISTWTVYKINHPPLQNDILSCFSNHVPLSLQNASGQNILLQNDGPQGLLLTSKNVKQPNVSQNANYGVYKMTGCLAKNVCSLQNDPLNYGLKALIL